MALSKFASDSVSKPTTSAEMRKSVQAFAPRAKEKTFQTDACQIFDCGDRNFMTFLDSEGKGHCSNDKHWMEADFVLPVFCKKHRLRVALHMGSRQGEVHQTIMSDGRDGVSGVNYKRGPEKVEPGPRTFGMCCHGEHCQCVKHVVTTQHCKLLLPATGS
jgi:hypothetical protein